jgi:hypothetical protein
VCGIVKEPKPTTHLLLVVLAPEKKRERFEKKNSTDKITVTVVTMATTQNENVGELMKEFATNLGALQKTMESLAKVFAGSNIAAAVADGPSDGKKTKRKRVVEEGAPKRALSAYQYYFKDNLNKVKLEFPTLGNKEVMQIVGERWRTMDAVAKKVYEEKGVAAKEVYATELEVKSYVHLQLHIVEQTIYTISSLSLTV